MSEEQLDLLEQLEELAPQAHRDLVELRGRPALLVALAQPELLVQQAQEEYEAMMALLALPAQLGRLAVREPRVPPARLALLEQLAQ